MIDILDEVDGWLGAGRRVVLATVVDVVGSGPRSPGAHMAVNDAGEVAGSVSGGCVEGAVVEEALALLDGGTAHAVSYGISDELAMGVGLTCGGTVRIFLEELSAAGSAPLRAAIGDALGREQPVAVCTVTHGPATGAKLVVRPGAEPIGSLGEPELDRVAGRDAAGLLGQGLTEERHYGTRGEALQAEVTVLFESFAPRPHLVVFGAVDFTRALVQVGRVLGYRTSVCDPRATFATRERFPEADEVVVDWPDRYLEKAEVDARTVVCVLTHDPKLDVPALVAAVRTPAAYIGAMGSRRTHADRLRRLRDAGLVDDDLARIAGPIGLDIGARTPEETAISILAEVVAHRASRGGGRLSGGAGPIHG